MPYPLKLRLLSAFLLSAAMSFLMTTWVTWLNLGFGPHFLAQWLRAWLSVWPTAFVIVVLIGPSVLRLAQKLAGPPPSPPQ